MKFLQIFITLGLLFLTATAFGQPPDTLLVCRGGGNLNVEYKNSLLTIKFKKGQNLVDKDWNGLEPGECVFRDRKVAPAEPEQIRWKVKNFSISWTGKDEKISHDAIKILRSSKKYQSFHVRDDAQGSFEVFQLGNSK